jgi:hypothetical protein
VAGAAAARCFTRTVCLRPLRSPNLLNWRASRAITVCPPPRRLDEAAMGLESISGSGFSQARIMLSLEGASESGA